MSFFNQLISGTGRNTRRMPSTTQSGAQLTGLPTNYTLADVLRMRGGNRTSTNLNQTPQVQTNAQPDPTINLVNPREYKNQLTSALSNAGLAGGDELSLLQAVPGVQKLDTISGMVNQLNQNPALLSGVPQTSLPVLQRLGVGRQTQVQQPPPLVVDPGLNEIPEISGDQGYLPQTSGLNQLLSQLRTYLLTLPNRGRLR